MYYWNGCSDLGAKADPFLTTTFYQNWLSWFMKKDGSSTDQDMDVLEEMTKNDNDDDNRGTRKRGHHHSQHHGPHYMMMMMEGEDEDQMTMMNHMHHHHMPKGGMMGEHN